MTDTLKVTKNESCIWRVPLLPLSIWCGFNFPSLCISQGEVTRDNPYEDVKLSPMCLPIARPQGPKVMEVE